MKKTQKALKLALEALENSLEYVEEEAENAQRLYGQYPTRQARIQGLKDDARKHMDAITAIREALADHIPDAGKMVEQSTCKQALQVEQPAQPSKPWVGLTEVEVWSTYKNLWMFHPAEEPRLAGDILKFARAIEAKLREKNA